MTVKPVDVLSDEGHKRLKKLKKAELIDLVENIVITYRLRFKILEASGVNYKEIIGLLEDDEE